MIGKVVDRYEILREIGRGGMGLVFEVKDQRGYQRSYALKVMNPTVAARDDLVRRFMDEARLLGELNDPNIVFAYDFWSTDDHTYLLMEFIQGGTLKEMILERGAMPWPEALPLFEQVVSAISAAHEKSIIHRDIKPSNVLLHRSGQGKLVVKVTDFGLAKIQEDAAAEGLTRTMSQFGGGTLSYMPPEQVLGLHNTDKRSDVYSLGITLYTMLAGKNPFEEFGNSFSIQRAIVDHTFKPLDQAIGGVPAPLVQFVEKATAKEPGDRFADATQMLAELQGLRLALLAGEEATIAPEATIAITPEAISEPEKVNQKVNRKERVKRKRRKEKAPRDDRDKPKKEQGARRLRGGLLGVGLALVALAVLGLWWVLERAETPEAPAAKVSIYTRPGDARLAIEDGPFAEGPLEGLSLSPGRTRVRAERAGYALLDTVLDVQRGPQEFALVLRKEPVALAEGDVPEAGESAPSGTSPAETGTSTEQPVSQQGPPSVARIEPPETLPERGAARPEELQQEVSEEPPAQPAATGAVNVLVRPYGDIYVNGQLLASETNGRHTAELPSGTHRVRASHPSYGSWTKDIRLTVGQSQDVLFDFGREYRVTITSAPSVAEILVDGQPTGQYTPREMRVRAGERTIAVRKEGYAMASPPKTLVMDRDRTSDIERLHFALRPAQ